MRKQPEEKVFVYQGLQPSHQLWHENKETQRKAMALDEEFPLRGMRFTKGVPVRVSDPGLVKKLTGMGAFEEVTGEAASGATEAPDTVEKLLDALPGMRKVDLQDVAEKHNIPMPSGYVKVDDMVEIITAHLLGESSVDMDES